MADFQRRHYQVIAAIVASAQPEDCKDEAWEEGCNSARLFIEQKLADYFAADNHLFNRSTFAAACRGEHYKGKRRAA